MTKISTSTAAVVLAQDKKYKPPFDKRTTLFNVKAAKEAVSQGYTRETSAHFDLKSNRTGG